MRAIYWFMTLHLRIRKLFGAPTAGLHFIPAVPAVGIFSAVWGALVAVVKAFFEGISICFANPVVLTVLVVAFGGGVWAGIDWSKHKVEVANAKVTALQQQWKEAEDTSERRLGAAMAAREAAEKAAKENEDRAAAAAATARRLRGKLASQSPASPASGQGVQWFSSILGTDGTSAAKR